MNRLLSGCMGCAAATISGLSILTPGASACAGTLPVAATALSVAAPAKITTVQWADAWWRRQQWDYAWGTPPYSFPKGASRA
jgi:hypothetical protein